MTMIMKGKILLTSTLALGVTVGGGAAAATSYELPPPSRLIVAIEAVDLEDVRVQAGAEYSVYIRSSRLAHLATIVDVDGTPLYDEVPVRSEKCSDSSLAWPDRTVAHVQVARAADDQRVELVAYATSLNPCVLILDLPLASPQPPAEAPPNRGDPL